MTVVVSGLLLLIFPVGFTNYDTIYYLLWGKQIALGSSPDYSPPLVPTPHPLYDLLGAVTTPLGDGSITVAVVIAYISLGLLAWLVYRLGKIFFDRPVGALAAVFIMTAAPILSTGLRAYIDIPFMVMCLTALLIEARRPRAGLPVLAILVPAGLLRPEAWLFSIAYFLWLAFELEPRPGTRIPTVKLRQGGIDRELVGLAVLAISAPLAWALRDFVAAGNRPLSFTRTRDNVETLDRATGPIDVVLYGPRRLGEVLQWPGMVGALAGILLTLKLMPRRAVGLAVAAALALAAFALLGAAGLAIISRYTMLGASILSIFSAAAILGWRLLERGDPWRRRWQFIAGFVVVLYLVWLPNQINLLKTVDRDLSNQGLVERDLKALVDDGSFDAATADPPCLPVSVPNHRAVPRLAFWLDLEPAEVVSIATQSQPESGLFLAPAREFTLHNFILDPGEPGRATTKPPPGFELTSENRSWKVYSSCDGAAKDNTPIEP